MKTATFASIALLIVAVFGADAVSAQRAAADDKAFEKALDIVSDDPSGARRLIEPLANKGDAEALNFLATLLQYGGPDWQPDAQKANQLFEAAAKAGSKAAAMNIAIRLMTDEAADHKRAVELLQFADTDDKLQKITTYPWGRAYLFGWGVDRDMTKGVELLETFVTSDAGGSVMNTDAHFLLGRAYDNGWGVEPNPDRAYPNMRAAADEGDMRAQWHVAMMLLQGQGADPDAEAAFNYVQQSAEQGYRPGMVSYAVMLATGEGTTEDDLEARKWYRAAATAGSAHAMRSLGGMLINGEGGSVDAALGFALLEIAAEAGDAKSITALEELAIPRGVTRAQIDAAKAGWTSLHRQPDADD